MDTGRLARYRAKLKKNSKKRKYYASYHVSKKQLENSHLDINKGKKLFRYKKEKYEEFISNMKGGDQYEY